MSCSLAQGSFRCEENLLFYSQERNCDVFIHCWILQAVCFQYCHRTPPPPSTYPPTLRLPYVRESHREQCLGNGRMTKGMVVFTRRGYLLTLMKSRTRHCEIHIQVHVYLRSKDGVLCVDLLPYWTNVPTVPMHWPVGDTGRDAPRLLRCLNQILKTPAVETLSGWTRKHHQTFISVAPRASTSAIFSRQEILKAK